MAVLLSLILWILDSNPNYGEDENKDTEVVQGKTRKVMGSNPHTSADVEISLFANIMQRLA